MTDIAPPRKRKPFSWPIAVRLAGRGLAGLGLALLLALVFFPEHHRGCANCQVIASNPWRYRRRRVPMPDGTVRATRVKTPVFPGGVRLAPGGSVSDAFRLNEQHANCRCAEARHPDFGDWYDWLVRQFAPPKPAAPAAGPSLGGAGSGPPGR